MRNISLDVIILVNPDPGLPAAGVVMILSRPGLLLQVANHSRHLDICEIFLPFDMITANISVHE